MILHLGRLKHKEVFTGNQICVHILSKGHDSKPMDSRGNVGHSLHNVTCQELGCFLSYTSAFVFLCTLTKELVEGTFVVYNI